MRKSYLKRKNLFLFLDLLSAVLTGFKSAPFFDSLVTKLSEVLILNTSDSFYATRQGLRDGVSQLFASKG
jgi:hypothetical protein